ncbi:hypothetical protein SAMN05192569_10486 [Parageobacillus thermantarcticus]|uniref:Uncharacterized protein n=1 Tax=Parageobacillus thermantarcticus TaxID=186116 RepID=A0A1I0TQN9_9BACL|nr:hypothetical protein SAMN05192569_10486 [Parageobacillus thermantarcticus]
MSIITNPFKKNLSPYELQNPELINIITYYLPNVFITLRTEKIF